MTPRILSLAVLSLLVLASSLMAKPYDPERSAPQNDQNFRRELAPNERMHLRKHMKHRQMGREFRHEAMRHRNMARLHKREFMRDRMGGPQPGPMGPPPHLRRQMHFHDQHFDGPLMPPDRPQGPPPHMRFRDGKRPPRAL